VRYCSFNISFNSGPILMFLGLFWSVWCLENHTSDEPCPSQIFYKYNNCFKQYLFSLQEPNPHLDQLIQNLFHSPSPTTSCLSSPIFIPSHSLSPTNNTGNTPYIITSPPPYTTNLEIAWPHQQMIEHVAWLLNIKEEEVYHHFPTNHLLLSINYSPPLCSLSQQPPLCPCSHLAHSPVSQQQIW